MRRPIAAYVEKLRGGLLTFVRSVASNAWEVRRDHNLTHHRMPACVCALLSARSKYQKVNSKTSQETCRWLPLGKEPTGHLSKLSHSAGCVENPTPSNPHVEFIA